MKVHEYQAKDLLRAAGVAVPAGVVVTTPEEAAAAYDQLGGGLIVVKAQVHAGGRGKGIAIGPDEDRAEALEIASGRKPRKDGMARGVQLVKSRDEAKAAAASLLGKTLVTYQTGAEGQAIRKVLVTVGHDIARELYLGMAVDRATQCPVLMASTEGGVEIETVAHEHPEKIHKEPIDVGVGLADFQARKVSHALGLKGDSAKKGEAFFKSFVKFFLDKDASLAEINPLIVTDKGDVLALDAKLNFDDNALFRHKDIAALLDPDEEDPNELRAAKSGLSYVSLDGDIACLVNGAGLAMSTMDLIKYHGGEPANFLDVGGGANQDQVLEAFRILLSSPRVKAVLVNIFGGIMQCDIIASALLAAYDEIDFRVPLVVRLEGTNVELGKKLLSESGRKIITADGLTDAAKKVVAAARGAA
ncbi:MAG TPA: ADP-forming succinate--CoA ligase subunit beta [Isosphaeraceae bacterium]